MDVCCFVVLLWIILTRGVVEWSRWYTVDLKKKLDDL